MLFLEKFVERHFMRIAKKSFIYTCVLFVLVCLNTNTINAQSYFRHDTLVVASLNLKRSDSAAANYVITKSSLDFNLKKALSDNPAYAEKDWDDKAWKIDTSQTIINEEALQTIWYRFKVKIDSNYINYPMILTIESEGILELYIDGVLHTRIGRFALGQNAKKPDYFYLNTKPIILTFPEAKTYQFAIRFKSCVDVADGQTARFQFRLEDAKYTMVQKKFGGIFSAFVFLGFGTLFFTLFLIHLLFYLFYRREKDNFIFAVFALSVAITLLGTYAFYNAEIMTFDKFYFFCFNYAPIISCFSLCAFISYVFNRNYKVLYIITALCAVVILFATLDAYGIFLLSAPFIWVLISVSLLYTIVMIVWAMLKRVPGSLILGSGVLFFLLYSITLLVVSSVSGGLHFNPFLSYLTLIAILGIPISISAYLAWRFSTTSKNLLKQLKIVEDLSLEKQYILQNQNEVLEQQVVERTKELQLEKQKSEDLLLNILPNEVAIELKEKGTSQAQYYDEVTVLFTDFVNFTALSEAIGAKAMLEELNECFTAFDFIMEKYGLEKIKTIGDAYLAVSGLPIHNALHAQNAINAAIDIINFVEQRRAKSSKALSIRIGINSGPLVAGIVGVKKFAYDIWGDTVNTAARMEQLSVAGRINISKDTFQLTKDTFTFEPRGEIQVKGKGAIEMYFVQTQ